jgi:F-box protein 21
MNRFPHAYLSTHKRAIPISLVHIFASIGTRLGLQVSPVNYPGTVLAHVIPKERDLQPIIVNPSSNLERDLAEELSTSRALDLLQSMDPTLSAETNLKPCGGQLMLLRASRNIISILPSLRYMQSPIVYPSVLFVLCTHLLFEGDNPTLEFLVSILRRKAQSLDCIFLLRDLRPVLNSRCQKVLQGYCNDVAANEDEIANTVRRRSVSKMRYFLGMPCRNSSGHLCFIYGWERMSPSNCSDYDITPPLVSDRIERETYHILRIDGAHQCMYFDCILIDRTYLFLKVVFLPEGSITPTTFTTSDVKALFESCPRAAVYFNGVESPNDPSKGVDSAEGRGRLLLSPHVHYCYPEDDDAGSSWVHSGSLSCDDLS